MPHSITQAKKYKYSQCLDLLKKPRKNKQINPKRPFGKAIKKTKTFSKTRRNRNQSTSKWPSHSIWSYHHCSHCCPSQWKLFVLAHTLWNRFLEASALLWFLFVLICFYRFLLIMWCWDKKNNPHTHRNFLGNGFFLPNVEWVSSRLHLGTCWYYSCIFYPTCWLFLGNDQQTTIHLKAFVILHQQQGIQTKETIQNVPFFTSIVVCACWSFEPLAKILIHWDSLPKRKQTSSYESTNHYKISFFPRLSSHWGRRRFEKLWRCDEHKKYQTKTPAKERETASQKVSTNQTT